MRQRCEYCDNWIDDTDEVCPHCGAPNAHMMVSGEGVPKTIEELKAFAVKHNLPLADMRFFIGEDFQEPRAFGIYQDGENYVVYKNKANGERAIRYQGHDEAYAVNELYQKMKSEVANQKAYQAKKQMLQPQKSLLDGMFKAVFSTAAIFTVVVGLIVVLNVGSGTSQGYYRYDDISYYYLDSWYYYDTNTGVWTPDADPPTALAEDSGDYWEGDSWDSSSGTSDFTNTDYYTDWESSNWDDDDWDWHSTDTWDTGATDWDSDW